MGLGKKGLTTLPASSLVGFFFLPFPKIIGFWTMGGEFSFVKANQQSFGSGNPISPKVQFQGFRLMFRRITKGHQNFLSCHSYNRSPPFYSVNRFFWHSSSYFLECFGGEHFFHITFKGFPRMPTFSKSYFEGHVEHNFKGWILGKIPGLNQLNFNLVAGAHFLSTEGNNPYTEISIGLDNLGWGKFRFLRLDYVHSYFNGESKGAFVFGLIFLNLIE